MSFRKVIHDPIVFTAEELDSEIWAKYPLADGYEISNLGRVRSYWVSCPHGSWIRSKVRYIKGLPANRGYLHIMFKTPDGFLRKGIHVAVLETFVGLRPGADYQACHNNGKPTDNRLSNLRWDTIQANADDRKIHGTVTMGEDLPQAKLTEFDVRRVWQFIKLGWKLSEIATYFNVHGATISDIKRGATWKHIYKELAGASLRS